MINLEISCTRSFVTMVAYINGQLLVWVAADSLGLLELLVDDQEAVEAEVERVYGVAKNSGAHPL